MAREACMLGRSIRQMGRDVCQRWGEVGRGGQLEHFSINGRGMGGGVW